MRKISASPELRELVTGFGSSGHVALYRFDPAADAVYVSAFRHQKEAGYRSDARQTSPVRKEKDRAPTLTVLALSLTRRSSSSAPTASSATSSSVRGQH